MIIHRRGSSVWFSRCWEGKPNIVIQKQQRNTKGRRKAKRLSLRSQRLVVTWPLWWDLVTYYFLKKVILLLITSTSCTPFKVWNTGGHGGSRTPNKPFGLPSISQNQNSGVPENKLILKSCCPLEKNRRSNPDSMNLIIYLLHSQSASVFGALN